MKKNKKQKEIDYSWNEYFEKRKNDKPYWDNWNTLKFKETPTRDLFKGKEIKDFHYHTKIKYGIDIELLIDLYKTYSPSYGEMPMTELIANELDNLGVDYKMDANGQIYNFDHFNRPCLSAHMDHVTHFNPVKSLNIADNRYVFAEDTGLGADDKNGIYVILKLLAENRTKPFNFVFSAAEEIGGLLQELNGEISAACFSHIVVLDRKNNGDVIGFNNHYCKAHHEKLVLNKIKRFGYKSSTGIFSDANFLSKFANAVNLSVAYFNPHTNNEYTDLSGLSNATNMVRHLIG